MKRFAAAISFGLPGMTGYRKIDMEMLGIVASLVMVKELAWKFSVPSGDSDLYDPRDTCCNCVPQQPP